MSPQLFAEHLAIEPEPPASLPEEPVYDELRGYAVLADGSPAVEASADDDVKTLTAVATEGVDAADPSMQFLYAGEKTVTRLAAEAPDEPRLNQGIARHSMTRLFDGDPG